MNAKILYNDAIRELPDGFQDAWHPSEYINFLNRFLPQNKLKALTDYPLPQSKRIEAPKAPTVYPCPPYRVDVVWRGTLFDRVWFYDPLSAAVVANYLANDTWETDVTMYQLRGTHALKRVTNKFVNAVVTGPTEVDYKEVMEYFGGFDHPFIYTKDKRYSWFIIDQNILDNVAYEHERGMVPYEIYLDQMSGYEGNGMMAYFDYMGNYFGPHLEFSDEHGVFDNPSRFFHGDVFTTRDGYTVEYDKADDGLVEVEDGDIRSIRLTGATEIIKHPEFVGEVEVIETTPPMWWLAGDWHHPTRWLENAFKGWDYRFDNLWFKPGFGFVERTVVKAKEEK